MNKHRQYLHVTKTKEKGLPFTLYNIILFLFIIAISAMFLALTAAYQYTKIQSQQPSINLPSVFILSTLMILAGSFTIHKTKIAFIYDDIKLLKSSLLFTTILSLCFTVTQVLGWISLFKQNILITTGPLASYVYLISILHLIHLLIGLPFISYFTYKIYKQVNEPYKEIIFFSDQYIEDKLKLMRIYWHFLDGLWIYLAFFLLVNSFF